MLPENTKQWIALAVFIVLLAVAFATVFSKAGRARWKTICLAIAASSVTVGVFYWSLPYTESFIDRFDDEIRTTVFRSILAAIVVSIGVGAYYFKKTNQLRYGQSEVIFGIISSFTISSRPNFDLKSLPQIVAFTGAAYIVARGLNNWAEALEKRTEPLFPRTLSDHVLSWLMVQEEKPDSGK